MTLRKFNKLYSHYKDTFDLELTMRTKGVIYSKLNDLSIQDEEWL